MQYYNYFSKFKSDATWLRSLVHIQFLLETVQTAMSVADGFHWFVYGYGNLERLGEYYLANFDSPIISSLIAVISQGVYCWRIHHLSRWRISPFIIAFTSCCQVVGGFGIGIVNQKLGTIKNWEDRYNVFMVLWSVCNAITDTLIAGIMVFLLVSATSFKSSKTLTKLIRLVIETNLASALVAMAAFLTTVIKPVAPPKTSYFLCPGYVLSKLYSNSFITMLNNRYPNAGEQDGSNFSQRSRGECKRNHSRSLSHQARNSLMPNVAVAICMEKETRLDCDTQFQGKNSGSDFTKSEQLEISPV
ncbi:hypothetical protein Ac2012v2_000004 [Leucoagaricus gongylophorus]